MLTTPRRDIPYPEATDEAAGGNITDHLATLALAIDDSAADDQGLIAARPAAGVEGRYYWATDESKLYRDDGTTWHDLSGGAGGATDLDDLTDVTLTSPATGAVLQKSAGDWIDGLITNSNIDAAASIDLSKLAVDVATQAELDAVAAAKADTAHTHAIADVTSLQSELDAKAADADVVHIAGTETITGAKTFNNAISGYRGTVNTIFSCRHDADVSARFQLRTDGDMSWGGGSSAPDVGLSRTAAGILAMNSGDKFQQNEPPTVGDDLTNKTYVDAHIDAATSAHDASAVANTPAGNVAATDVQTAINELDTDKLALDGGGTIFGAGSKVSFKRPVIDADGIIIRAYQDGSAFDSFRVSAEGTIAAGDADGPLDVFLQRWDAGIWDIASGLIRTTSDPYDQHHLTRKGYVDAHINDTAGAHAASAISYGGGTGMSATDVEAAIDELATEKANTSQIVAPQPRLIAQASGQVQGGHGAGVTRIFGAGGQPTMVAADINEWLNLRLNPAQFDIAGYTTKYRISAYYAVNGVAQTGCAYEIGLHSVTSRGGTAGGFTGTIGTAQTGSTVSVSAPGAGAGSNLEGSQFDPPSTGMYALGVKNTGASNSPSGTRVQITVMLWAEYV